MMQNYFELFQLPQQFEVDEARLMDAYREFQRRFHPDKFVRALGAEKRLAMQWSTLSNEAYQVLKDPQKRALYLCELHGIDVGVESNTQMSSDFLLQQIQWREELEEVQMHQDESKLQRLEQQFKTVYQTYVNRLAHAFKMNDFQGAAGLVRQMMFVEKMMNEIASLSLTLNIKADK
jgi:molecular chaperone HscB